MDCYHWAPVFLNGCLFMSLPPLPGHEPLGAQTALFLFSPLPAFGDCDPMALQRQAPLPFVVS